MTKLINKTYRAYDRLSRYESFPVYYDTINKKYCYGVLAQLDPNTAYSIYTTVNEETFDSLALKAYGNPTYFWVIANFNRILNSYEKIPPGIQVKIPTLSSIQFEVTNVQ